MLLTCAAPLALAHVARANSVSDEFTVGKAHAGAGSPATPFVGDRLRLSLNSGDAWSFRLGGSYMRYEATSMSSSQDVFVLSGGTTFEPSDHFAFGVDASVSPLSTGTSNVPVTIPGPPARAATVKLDTSTIAAAFIATAEYDTAGQSNAETVVELDSGATWYWIDERARNKNLQTQCAAGTARVCGYLSAPGVALTQIVVSAGLTETLFRTTDLDVLGTYFVYTHDPASLGYTAGTYSATPLAGGIPSQPLRYLVQPSQTHWFGPLGIELKEQYGQYVDDLGFSVGGGVKVTVKIGRAFKVSVGGDVLHDVETGYGKSWTWWASAGARLRF